MAKTFPDQLINQEEAAEFLGVKPMTLRDWRKPNSQQGPPYIRLGAQQKIRYLVSDLMAFIQQRRVVPSPKQKSNVSPNNGIEKE